MRTIVHLCLESPDRGWGGLATAVHLLAQTTAGSGIKTTVVSAEGRTRSAVDVSGYRVLVAAVPQLGARSFYESPDRLGLGSTACVALLETVRAAHASDEVHIIVHNEELAPLIEWVRLERWVRTVSVVSHGLMPQEHPGRPDLHEAQRQELASADVVFAVSRSQVNQLTSHYPDLLGVRYLPLPLSRLVRRGYSPRPKKGQFLAAGRSVPQKGFDILLRACKLLEVDSSVSLDLVLGHGEASYEAICRKLVAEATNPVQVHQWLGKAALLSLLAKSAAVVVPSRFEPLGLIAAEAMSLGRPVIASAVGGLPELISSPDVGVLVPASALHGPHPNDLRAGIETMLNRGVEVTNGPELLMEKYSEDCTLAALAHELGW